MSARSIELWDLDSPDRVLLVRDHLLFADRVVVVAGVDSGDRKTNTDYLTVTLGINQLVNLRNWLSVRIDRIGGAA
jgi:hypothetical protein